MYQCSTCGHLFEVPLEYDPSRERLTVPGADVSLRAILLSPCCGSECKRVRLCDKCERPVPEADLRHGLCPKCVRSAADELRYLLYNEFTEAERAALDELMDGVPLSEVPHGTGLRL